MSCNSSSQTHLEELEAHLKRDQRSKSATSTVLAPSPSAGPALPRPALPCPALNQHDILGVYLLGTFALFYIIIIIIIIIIVDASAIHLQPP